MVALLAFREKFKLFTKNLHSSVKNQNSKNEKEVFSKNSKFFLIYSNKIVRILEF